MNNHIDIIRQLVEPYGFQQNEELNEEPIFFSKRFSIQHLGSPFAFTILTITLTPHSYILEGLNEFRLQRALRAGLIELDDPEKLDELKEVLFEATYDQFDRCEAILGFVIGQLQTVEREKRHTDLFKKALVDLEMVSAMAKQVE